MIKKKRLSAIIGLIAVCVISLAAALFAACAPKKGVYYVSGDENSKVTAELTLKGANTYKLAISGSGKMRDFVNSADAPWYGKAKLIDEIEIADGVTFIGRNAFRNASVSSVVLPSSVTEIGYEIADKEVMVCAAQGVTVTTLDTNRTVYAYSEGIPATNDRYWQKGASDKDIVAADEDLTEKLYWHYENGKPVVWEKTKVLFIGNSFTFRNGEVDVSGGIPRIFDNIAKDFNKYVETYAVTGSAITLSSHSSSTTDSGAQVDKILNAYSDIDYVVLQEQSKRPVEAYDSFLSGVEALVQKVAATQDNAEVVLYETWGYPAAVEGTQNTIQQYERKLNRAYNKVSLALGGLKVAPVGRAFTYVYNTPESKITLWGADNMHQSYHGAYLSACVHAATLLGVDVRKASFVGEAEFSAPELSAEVLTELRNAAYSVCAGEVNVDSDVTIESLPLSISVWGRYISENDFKTLLSMYEVYCEDHDIGTAEISYTYYDDASYHGIADYTEKSIADKAYDILFPVGNNINSSTDSKYKDAVGLEKTAMGINVFDQTGRYVAKLTDTKMAQSFYEWIVSDEAKMAMDPTFVPADAPTPVDPQPVDPQPQSTYDLEIAVWGRYIDEDQFKLLFEAFKTYCTGLSIDTSKMHYKYYTEHGVDDFTKAIKDNKDGSDVVFAGGGNIKDKLQVVGIEVAGNSVTLTADCVKGETHSSGRLVSRTTPNALSYMFAQFCVSDEGAAALNSYTPTQAPTT